MIIFQPNNGRNGLFYELDGNFMKIFEILETGPKISQKMQFLRISGHKRPEIMIFCYILRF